MKPSAPLVAHVIHHLGTGGMENGLVNIINRTPRHRFRHAIVCLTDAGPFARRIERPDVAIISLHRAPGHSFGLYWKLLCTLRRLRPDIVHTRNLAALEAQVPALFIPGACRVHGEHGRDVIDLHGASRKYNLLRRTIRPLIQRYIAVSKDLAQWLQSTIGVDPARVRQIYNGVAQEVFSPRGDTRPDLAPRGFLQAGALVVGTVGRLAEVKGQLTLVRAVGELLRTRPELRDSLRLVVVGDGPMRERIECSVHEQDLSALAWLPGDRDDVPDLLRMMDIFVMPSLAEGISNTILEAMSTGLPVIATRVGGTPELVDDGVTGLLVPPDGASDLARAIDVYFDDRALRHKHSVAGRARVAQRFTWEICVNEYMGVYDDLLRRGRARGPQPGEI